MLEIAKAAFEYEDWFDASQYNDYQLENNDDADLYYYSVNNYVNESIVHNGRLLINYFYYDLQNSIYLANERVLIILLKENVQNLYEFYMLRIFNLITHGDSIVYRDYFLYNTSDCTSMGFYDDTNLNFTLEDSYGSINIYLMCNAAIRLYTISLCEEIFVNVKNEYWENNDEIKVNVTQFSPYNDFTSHASFNIMIKRQPYLEDRSILLGSLTLIFISII